jgi:hypothetical protein
MNDVILWLAGYLEGEGSFLAGPPTNPNTAIISLQTTDRDIAERIARIFKVKACACRLDLKNPKWKRVYSVRLRGRRAVWMMKQLRPLMGKRRKKQIDFAIKSHELQKMKIGIEGVKNVRTLLDMGYKQREIALLCGISRQYVSDIKVNRKRWFDQEMVDQFDWRI